MQKDDTALTANTCYLHLCGVGFVCFTEGEYICFCTCFVF